jgi:nucleoside-diphosphate-sugar epimerase
VSDVPEGFTASGKERDMRVFVTGGTGAIGRRLIPALISGGTELPVTSGEHEFLGVACAAGLSDADFACVARVVRHQAGSSEHDTGHCK